MVLRKMQIRETSAPHKDDKKIFLLASELLILTVR